MSEGNERNFAAFESYMGALDVLIDAMSRRDVDKSNEAVTVMLTRAVDLWGPNSGSDRSIMQQFFPVMDRIKTHIDNGDFEAATRQAKLFKTQIGEIQLDAAKSEGNLANTGRAEPTANSATKPNKHTAESLQALGFKVVKPSGRGFILPMGRPSDPKHGADANNSEGEAD